MFKALAIAGLSLSSLVISNIAQADWQLVNDKSQLSFVSIKKNSIAEANHFTNIEGKLSDKGEFSVNVDLTSAETLIPIRNERLTKLSAVLKNLASMCLKGLMRNLIFMVIKSRLL